MSAMYLSLCLSCTCLSNTDWHSPGHDTIDGQYLVANGTDIGVMLDSQTPVRVYTTASSKAEGLLELHTYPVGIVDHAIALHGPSGLMNMVDMANPKGKHTNDDNVVNVFDTFRVVEDKLTNDGSGKWYAFPTERGGYVVKWYDGELAPPPTVRVFAHRGY